MNCVQRLAFWNPLYIFFAFPSLLKKPKKWNGPYHLLLETFLIADGSESSMMLAINSKFGTFWRSQCHRVVTGVFPQISLKLSHFIIWNIWLKYFRSFTLISFLCFWCIVSNFKENICCEPPFLIDHFLTLLLISLQ